MRHYDGRLFRWTRWLSTALVRMRATENKLGCRQEAMRMTRQLTAIIEREDDAFVALCPELDIASQGDLQEALELFLETASPQEIDQRFGKRGSDPSATGRDSEFRFGRGV
jgi:hypothetical protein